MSSHIVVVGSLNADFVLRAPRLPAPGETVVGTEFAVHAGGKGANQAYAAAKLGGRVSMVGQVGGDTHGSWLKDNLSSVGVDVSGVNVDSRRPSGVAHISVDDAGLNQIVIVPGANGTFGPEQLEASRGVIESARVVLLQLEIPVETVAMAVAIAKRAGATVILDPAPARALASGLMSGVDYLTPNETELTRLCGATVTNAEGVGLLARAVRRTIGAPAVKVIVKMGAAGALLIDGEAPHIFWPAFAVEAVDTTAAGDAFNAAFAVALAENLSEAEAGHFASAAAACSVGRAGAQISMPVREEVLGMMKNGRRRKH